MCAYNPIQLDAIIKRALAKKATDIHLSAESKPALRVDGQIVLLDENVPLRGKEVEEIARKLLMPETYERFKKGEDVDASFSHGDDARFRIHVYRERRGIAIALRYLPREVPPYGNLGLPFILQDIIRAPQGLFLIAGPTGSGKTTTRSALIETLNESSAKHIITLEDVIEYRYENKRCIIKQRAIGPDGDASSYHDALVSAMRQDPDVIVVGDLREENAMALALSAAQTGHLIIAEIHAPTTYHALHRIITSFAYAHQGQAGNELAQHLVGVVAQRLIPKKEGGRALALEVLLPNTAVKTQLRECRVDAIADTIRINRASGMILLEDAVRALIAQGIISSEEAKQFVTL